MGRVQVDIYKREREFHASTLSDVDAVKGLITLRAQLDIYNDLMHDGGGRLGACNWKNVNQEVVALYADLDMLMVKVKFAEGEQALIDTLMSGITVEDVSYMLGIEPRRIERLLDKICRKIVEYNHAAWLKWAYVHYIKCEWKGCIICGEQYPATLQFFYAKNDDSDGLRGACVLCTKRKRGENYLSATKVAKNASASSIVEGINIFEVNAGKSIKKKPAPRKKAKSAQGHDTKVFLPDGTKVMLPHNNDFEQRKLIVDGILAKYNYYFTELWEHIKTKSCLDALSTYLCKQDVEPCRADEILSGYKAREMREGSRKHVTFSGLSKKQRFTLGLLDIDDGE